MKPRTLTRTAAPVFLLLAWLLLPQTAHCFYNPSTGRWLSRDPTGELDGASVYEFCRNVPTTYIDENGLQCCQLRVSLPRIIIEDLPIRVTDPAPTTTPVPPGTTMPPLYPPVPAVPAPVPTTPGSPSSPAPAPAPAPAQGPAGPLPPDQGGPPWPYGPNGDCTPKRKNFLQYRVKAICGQARSCEGITDCAELWRRAHINEACMTARQNVMSECYRGGDARHKKDVDDVRKVLQKCWDEYAKAGGA
jgi:hypothetical protein